VSDVPLSGACERVRRDGYPPTLRYPAGPIRTSSAHLIADGGLPQFYNNATSHALLEWRSQFRCAKCDQMRTKEERLS